MCNAHNNNLTQFFLYTYKVEGFNLECVNNNKRIWYLDTIIKAIFCKGKELIYFKTRLENGHVSGFTGRFVRWWV